MQATQTFINSAQLKQYETVGNGVFTPEEENDKTNVEPVHSYDAFHTRSGNDGVKGIIGMHRFNICLVVVFLWCENTISPTTLSHCRYYFGVTAAGVEFHWSGGTAILALENL